MAEDDNYQYSSSKRKFVVESLAWNKTGTKFIGTTVIELRFFKPQEEVEQGK